MSMASELGAVAVASRSDLRLRRAATLGLAVLAAVSIAAVLATLAGSRRADTSFDRFLASSRSGDALYFLPGAGTEVMDALRSIEGVEIVAPFTYVAAYPEGVDEAFAQEGGAFVSLDGQWLVDVDRPRVLEGRSLDGAGAQEMVVNEVWARSVGAGPGDVVRMRTISPEQAVGEDAGDEPAGPVIDMTVIGIVRAPLDISANAGGAIAYLPVAFADRYEGEVGFVSGGASIVLAEGTSGFERFAAAAQSVSDSPEVAVDAAAAGYAGVGDAIDVQVVALRVIAAVLALVGVVIVGQAAGRRVAANSAAVPSLRAVGFTRGQLAATLLAPIVPIAVASALGGALLAVAASPLFPRGLARAADPSPGVRVDLTVLVVGGLAAMVLLLLIAGVAVLRLVLAGNRGPGRSTPRLSFADRLQRLGLPVTAVQGVRYATTRGIEGAPVPVGAAIASIAVGLTGVLAAIVFGSSLGRVIDSPARHGVPFDAQARLGLDIDPDERSAEDVAADPAVARLTEVDYADGVVIDGEGIPGYGIRAIEGPPAVTVVDGRPPARMDEAMLCSDSMERLDASIGSMIDGAGVDGPVPLRVVGRCLVAIIADGDYDQGIVLTQDGLRQLETDSLEREYFIGWARGADIDGATERLRGAGLAVGGASPPSAIINLEGARGYPGIVIALLAIVAAGGLAHAVTTTGRRRRRDLAVLRAIGFTRAQTAGVLLWQAAILVVIGLGIAVPLGIAIGRAGWRIEARSLGAAADIAIPLPSLVGLAGGALALAIVVGASAGRRLPRVRLTDDAVRSSV
jgi:hypothetical protein